jgi:outer membrane protein
MQGSSAALLLACFCTAAGAERLTLRAAEQLALRTHPQLQYARSAEQAEAQVVQEVRSTLYPQVFGSVTGAVAEDDNTRILAGGLNNPIIYNRLGMGVTVSQRITDFGRTRHLSESASLRAKAQGEATQATRAEIVLNVDRAYYAALRAQAVLKVADETVKARQIVADQTATMASNKLKSELDVTFARVNLEEAKLLLTNAQNEAKSALAELASALGSSDVTEYELSEEALPPPLAAEAGPLVQEALISRPEVKQARLQFESAAEEAKAARALKFPTVSAVGTAGYSPLGIERLQNHWEAAGVNIDIPFLNGGLFSARRSEAEARRAAAEHLARDVANRVARDVRLAYLAALTAQQRLDLTAQLLEQAGLSLKLAQARYDLGLSSIVELSQAQLNVTRAQIAQASARFDYQSNRAVLDYQTGRL